MLVSGVPFPAVVLSAVACFFRTVFSGLVSGVPVPGIAFSAVAFCFRAVSSVFVSGVPFPAVVLSAVACFFRTVLSLLVSGVPFPAVAFSAVAFCSRAVFSKRDSSPKSSRISFKMSSPHTLCEPSIELLSPIALLIACLALFKPSLTELISLKSMFFIFLRSAAARSNIFIYLLLYSSYKFHALSKSSGNFLSCPSSMPKSISPCFCAAFFLLCSSVFFLRVAFCFCSSFCLLCAAFCCVCSSFFCFCKLVFCFLLTSV